MTYEYIYQEAEGDHPTFLLLHGTGGDETNLLKIAEFLNSEYGVLSLRGDVDEGGSLRFFKRRAEGDYDMEDLEMRGKQLLEFLENKTEELGIDSSSLIPVGFSNGSNIALHVLLTEETPFEKSLLMAPMYPPEVDTSKDLTGHEVFLSMGEQDPIVNQEQSKKVIEDLEKAGADVTVEWTHTHQVTREVLQAAKKFIEQ
jgi:phospholipase/carboxylesterase